MSRWVELTFSTLRLLQEQGGPTFTDWFLPADEMIERVYKEALALLCLEARKSRFPSYRGKDAG